MTVYVQGRAVSYFLSLLCCHVIFLYISVHWSIKLVAEKLTHFWAVRVLTLCRSPPMTEVGITAPAALFSCAAFTLVTFARPVRTERTDGYIGLTRNGYTL